jgi:glycosyltransferase involved in cell wall biosynthesis
MKVSAVIPAYKDPLVHPTIESLLLNSELGDQFEVIVVLDGYWPEKPIIQDDRVVIVHLGKNRGMREAINAGVSVARGEFILRSDQHCAFAKGFDRTLMEDCQPNWIMTAKRYFLDPVKWEVMKELEPVITEKLIIQDNKKFSGAKWKSRDRKTKDLELVESMAMQGSGWFMPKKWFMDVIYPLQTEGYGQMYQDSHEMIFKTWKAGGKLMVSKKTWFAHKHRSFTAGRHEGTKTNPSNRGGNFESGQYALKVWREYYEKEIKQKWHL